MLCLCVFANVFCICKMFLYAMFLLGEMHFHMFSPFVVFLKLQVMNKWYLMGCCGQSLGWKKILKKRGKASIEIYRFKIPTLSEQKDHTITHTRSSAVTGCPERLVPTTMRASLFFMSSRLSARARMAMISLATAMSNPVWNAKKKRKVNQSLMYYFSGPQLVAPYMNHVMYNLSFMAVIV